MSRGAVLYGGNVMTNPNTWQTQHEWLFRQCFIIRGVLSFGEAFCPILHRECRALITSLAAHVDDERTLDVGECRHDEVLEELHLLMRYISAEYAQLFEMLNMALKIVLERLRYEMALQEEVSHTVRGHVGASV